MQLHQAKINCRCRTRFWYSKGRINFLNSYFSLVKILYLCKAIDSSVHIILKVTFISKQQSVFSVSFFIDVNNNMYIAFKEAWWSNNCRYITIYQRKQHYCPLNMNKTSFILRDFVRFYRATPSIIQIDFSITFQIYNMFCLKRFRNMLHRLTYIVFC